MEIHSTSSGMRSSSYSSSTSGNNPLKSGGISPTSSSALARVTAQDASFSKFSLGSAQSEASVSQRAHQTLALLREACQRTCTLGEKVNKKNWLQINKTQCREFLRLRSLASALAKFFEELKNEAPDVQAECWTAAREMYKVIIITEEFVEDCSLPITPVRALKNFANGTNFVLIQYQLIWCIRVLKMVLCQAKGESNADFGSDLNDMDQCLSEEEKVDLEGYCTTDRKALLKKFEENTHPLKLKKSGPRSEGPEGRILKLLRSLAEENGMRGNSSSFVSSQGEGPSIMEQRVFIKCVYVEITELKKEKGPILGRGSYGSVFCANWLGEKVAVKNVQANYNVFKQEVGLQSGLWHPHILPLYAYSFDPVKEICYMVMELAQGNLRTYISTHGRNLTLESKVDTMLQIAEGMRYLHSKNLRHRDLKAENILVQWKGITALQDAQNVQAKVCDFGLATTKFNGSISIHRTLNVGASFWRAPEVLIESSGSDNNQRVGYRQEADVYSFAMIFYEVLTGKIPFQDVNISLSNFRVRVLNGERPELPRDCPDYLACYIKRCWHGLPEKRPSFADICKMLRHFKSLLLRIGERPPIDFNIFSIFTAADFEAIRYHLGMPWCINAIREGIVFKDVLLSWIIVEQYRLNARDEEKYNEVLLVAAENFADITGPGHDFPRAFNFIQDAAHSGYAEAQWKVGLFLELGWGVEKNETEAINWYNAAAEQNYVCALVELGRCYHLGRGVEKRDDKAVEYCRRAHNNSEDQTIRCIHELLIMLNQTKDPKHSEIAAKRLFELTFEEGRPLILGPNLQNIQYLVDALDKNATYEIGRHIVLILKEMAVDAEVKEEIIYSGGVAAIVKHLKMVKPNNEWCRDAVETLGILFDGSGTEAVYFSVQHDLIAVLDECLRYNAPCFVNVLIQCLKQNVSKLWLRRNSQVICSLMNVHSRAPGISNDKALEIRQRLAYFGFTDQA